MKVLDTTFLIDVIGGINETKSLFQEKELLLTTQINMFEVIRGLYLRKAAPAKIMQVMELFEHIAVLPLDDAAVVKSAEISATLIRSGQMISDNDCFIAGIALSKGISTIVTRNEQHFKRIQGITVQTY